MLAVQDLRPAIRGRLAGGRTDASFVSSSPDPVDSTVDVAAILKKTLDRFGGRGGGGLTSRRAEG